MSEIKNQYPVVIIGCGPAGAATSLFLSNAGIEHLVLDKATFPRDKVCGDACSGKTVFVLKKANPLFVDTLFQNTNATLASHGVVFAAPNGKAIDIPFDPNKKYDRPPGFTTTRLYFDNFLFEQIQQKCAAIQTGISNLVLVKNAQNGYTITFTCFDKTYTVQTPLIIGADGDKGLCRKQLLMDDALSKTAAVGLRAYYKGVTGMHPNNFIELHFLKDTLPGYLWIFPLPNGMANVGIGIDSEVVRKKKINLRAVLLDALANNPTIQHRFKAATLVDKIQGWGLPMGTKPTSISGDHFMLVGDGASLIDPFTGEGIGNALFSGMLSANAAIKAIEHQRYDATFLKASYDDELFKRLGDELKLSYTILKMVRYPWLFNFVINKANKSPELRKTISSMFADLDMRALLRKPSFYWKILTNQ